MSKVYIHTGIGDDSSAWGFEVIGNWGQDDGVGEMTNNGDGTFSITFIPKNYFGLTILKRQVLLKWVWCLEVLMAPKN